MPHLKKVLFSQQSRTSDIWVGSANSCLSAAPFALEVIFQKFNWVVQPRIEKYFEADSFRFVSVQNFAQGVAPTFRKKKAQSHLIGHFTLGRFAINKHQHLSSKRPILPLKFLSEKISSVFVCCYTSPFPFGAKLIKTFLLSSCEDVSG